MPATPSPVALLRLELRKHVDPIFREGCQRFFAEQVRVFGVRTPIVRKISAQIYQRYLKGASLQEVWKVSEALLKAGTLEECTVGVSWIRRRVKELAPGDGTRLERLVKNYVTNWATCDDLCTHVIGPFFTRFPQEIHRVDMWARAKNRWLRRASAVSLIPLVRHGDHLADAFCIADTLLLDEDDLVQKGYGWMLKEGSRAKPEEIFAFVMERKDRMPRTALRYAIEHYPRAMRKKAME
ncbi:MAG: DNA alkylation repair protein [Patescibacteria group bacterium]